MSRTKKVNKGTRANIANKPSVVAAILNERQHSHGDFTDNARVMQALKRVVREQGVNFHTLNDVQHEALDMLLHKIGRIVTGNPNFNDHWDDIGGYAKLVSDRIK